MVETVESIGEIEDVLTDLVRCSLCECIFHHVVVFGQFQHQGFFCITGCRENGVCLCVRILCLVFAQNGFDADDGIQDVWTGISLEGDKAVDIKNVILCPFTSVISS